MCRLVLFFNVEGWSYGGVPLGEGFGFRIFFFRNLWPCVWCVLKVDP